MGFQASVSLLVKNNIIDNELSKDIKWLWGIRCKEHIETLKDWEHQKYSLEQYNKAVHIWQNFETQLYNAQMTGKL